MSEDVKQPDNLQFFNDNPGAVRYGNFINYYTFHPPENRINTLPRDIWIQQDPLVVLDIGCNAGNLTISLYNFLQNCVNSKCYILGIDIDPILIERAKEQNTESNIEFCCLDFMNVNERNAVFSNYLSAHKTSKFSAVFCFSITMWIHLNHGDAGLRTFLTDVCDIGLMVVIEPQPWKCYKTAVKRMQVAKAKFNNFKALGIRNDVEFQIEQIVLQIKGVSKVYESDKTEWERKVLIFKFN